MQDENCYLDPKYYENRELSWLKFNERVLEEAKDSSVPLLERVKFLSITASNLDEFYRVRVASILLAMPGRTGERDISGLTVEEQLDRIFEAVMSFLTRQYNVYSHSLKPLLRREGIAILDARDHLTGKQKQFLQRYFKDTLRPALGIFELSGEGAFPVFENGAVQLLIPLQNTKKKTKRIAVVTLPGGAARLAFLPAARGQRTVVMLAEQVIRLFVTELFPSEHAEALYPFRVLRSAELPIDTEAEDMLAEMEEKLALRKLAPVVRLEVDRRMPSDLVRFLQEGFGIHEAGIYPVRGPLDLTFLMKLFDLPDFPQLRRVQPAPHPVPRIPEGSDIFACIREGDILLNHPYMSFDPVIAFLRQAAEDPEVLRIKQTLYRVSRHSPIIQALVQAAKNGKEVTVLVELKARFDEKNNVEWAKKLLEAGCRVIYGPPALKTHSKVTLVVRQEEGQTMRYVHLGTGNYNDVTARIYTDCGILSCRSSLGKDAEHLFEELEQGSDAIRCKKLLVAPLTLRSELIDRIRGEAEAARAGRPAHIIAKMNSVCDRRIMDELYAASAAGVRIELIVRGICCLKVGIPGVSENISVRSIVGNYLEHSRIFYFANGGEPLVYMGSADWMPRNLSRRIEVVFPVCDPGIRGEILAYLQLQLADNVKARILQPDGTYRRAGKRGKKSVNSQLLLATGEIFSKNA